MHYTSRRTKNILVSEIGKFEKSKIEIFIMHYSSVNLLKMKCFKKMCIYLLLRIILYLLYWFKMLLLILYIKTIITTVSSSSDHSNNRIWYFFHVRSGLYSLLQLYHSLPHMNLILLLESRCLEQQNNHNKRNQEIFTLWYPTDPTILH